MSQCHKPTEKDRDTIYHYTSQEGLRAILGSQSLRFTDILSLSDGRDGQHIYDLYVQAAKRVLKNHKFGKYASLALERAPERLANRPQRFCVACFSTEDNLNQWAHYVGKQRGYCIAFRRDAFVQAVKSTTGRESKHSIWYGDVDYDAEFDNELLQIARRFQDNFPDTSQESQALGYIDIATDFLAEKMLSPSSARFKHHGFRREEEFRIAFSWSYHDKPIDQISKDEKGISLSFQHGGSFLKPTVTVHFGKGGLIPHVHEVWIGPGNNTEVAEENLKFLMLHFGWKFDEIRIRKSEIPYRL